MHSSPIQPGALRQRARAATAAELEVIPWLALLEPAQRQEVVARLQVADAEVGERVCRIGRTANLWFGVIAGLLKMSNDDSGSQAITFTGLPPGGWFGEGTLLKREAYRYNVQALRRSTVAGLTSGWASSSPRAKSTASRIPTCASHAIWRRSSIRSFFPASAACSISPSRSSPIWSACRASASTRRSITWQRWA
jgi:hypothetical protein